MNNTDLRIVIVGAGIAGLATAASLARSGIRCEVYEQARLISEVGAGIQIAPNAARVLRDLGLGAALEEAGVRIGALEMRRWDDDRVLRGMRLDRTEQLFGAAYYAVHRADLHHMLLESVPVGTVHLGLRCVRVEEQQERVVLLFADGSSTHADVVIGADGIHSVVRDVLVSDEPRFSGQAVYRGVVRADRLSLPADDPKVLMWLGPGRHCVCYPISGGDRVSFAATAPAAETGVESWSAHADRERVLATYDGWHEAMREVIGEAEAIGQWSLYDRETVRTWSTPRTTIVGDAAHPMLPFMAQGANQALEDAAALAACLRDSDRVFVPKALAHYADVRQSRTEQIHRISRENTRMLHLPDGPEQRERDATLAANADVSTREWLYGYDAEEAVRPRAAS